MSSKVSTPVQLDKTITISCNANKVILSFKVFTIEDKVEDNFHVIEDNFEHRHLSSVSLSRLLRKRPKCSLLTLSLKMAELGESSVQLNVTN